MNRDTTEIQIKDGGAIITFFQVNWEPCAAFANLVLLSHAKRAARAIAIEAAVAVNQS